ncbi:malonic semialdehyde reductase [Rhodococcus tibetensis]|uniref:Malonic semialdehyde reductase n=1 Tax=Rhodococcus tibetensis TaxID=2965064 RepID=A0ABT1QJA4_9NOCA|nr:malonic semialdehyde reductase [Rhodococcus sp. FXJ9.536]MCQ4122336.1 malonic semialdehyde reductase [Rhodococcus sp. FXJ9.536]
MPFALDSTALDLLFREAHTTHAFADEPVTDEQVQAIYDLIKIAPTAFNQSPLRLTVVRSSEARQRLVQHMAEGNQAKTAAAPLAVILSADAEFHEELPRLFPAFPAAKDAFFSERSVREQSAVLNAAMQAAYFIIGVRALGLAAGPMNGIDHAGIQKEFLDEDHLPLMVVNIGKPVADGHFARSPRLDYAEVRTTR